MWTYWRDKHGILDALEQFPEALKDPVVMTLKLQAEAALKAIDTIMETGNYEGAKF